MRKFIFGLFLILTLSVLVNPVFATVGMQLNGTREGVATDINVVGGSSNDLSGSVFTIDLSKPSDTVQIKRLGTAVSALSGGVHNLTVNCALGDVFTLTPSTSTSIGASNLISGQSVSLILTTSGTSTYQMNFKGGAGNFTTAGYLDTGATSSKIYTINFISNGTRLYETGRTAAMGSN